MSESSSSSNHSNKHRSSVHSTTQLTCDAAKEFTNCHHFVFGDNISEHM